MLSLSIVGTVKYTYGPSKRQKEKGNKDVSCTQVIQINEYHQIFTSALQACQKTSRFWLPDGEINGIFTAFMRWQSDELNRNFEHMNSMFDDATQEEIRQGYKPFWVDAKSTFIGGDTSSRVEKCLEESVFLIQVAAPSERTNPVGYTALSLPVKDVEAHVRGIISRSRKDMVNGVKAGLLQAAGELAIMLDHPEVQALGVELQRNLTW